MRKVLSEKNNRIYLYCIFAYMVLSVFVYWDRVLDIMNTTVYAFSYKYGFISRGVLGSLLQLYDSFVPFDAISYHTIYLISILGTAVFFLVLIWFVVIVMSRCNKEHLSNVKVIMSLIILITVPMFLGKDNFGRLDLYLMIIVIFCFILLICEKCEFLIIPAVTLATLIHEGFVFMNLNIILVLLLYKSLVNNDNKKRRKYVVILALSFVIPSMIFLYCEFFSHSFGQEVYDECLAVATKVSLNNDPHEEVLVHEILGQDVREMETMHHRWNLEDTPIFLVLFSPYIVLMVSVFRKYAKTAKNGLDKFITLIVLAGPLTLVPEILLKVDYGRYVYSILFYYLAIFVALLALRDKRVEVTADYFKGVISRNKVIAVIGVLYLFMFMPFRGYRICDVVTTITRMIFGN